MDQCDDVRFKIVDLMNDFLSIRMKRNTSPFLRFISSGNWKKRTNYERQTEFPTQTARRWEGLSAKRCILTPRNSILLSASCVVVVFLELSTRKKSYFLTCGNLLLDACSWKHNSCFKICALKMAQRAVSVYHTVSFSGLVFAAFTTSPFSSSLPFFPVYSSASLSPFSLFCEWRQISSSAVLPRSLLQGSAGSFTDWGRWLIHPVLPFGHIRCCCCCFYLLLFLFFCFLFSLSFPSLRSEVSTKIVCVVIMRWELSRTSTFGFSLCFERLKVLNRKMWSQTPRRGFSLRLFSNKILKRKHAARAFSSDLNVCGNKSGVNSFLLLCLLLSSPAWHCWKICSNFSSSSADCLLSSIHTSWKKLHTPWS